MSKLTPQEELFCREYVIDHNHMEAFTRAGYKYKKSIKEESLELLKKEPIQRRLDVLFSDKCRQETQRINRIIKELEDIAFADLDSGVPITVQQKLSALSELAKITGLISNFNIAIGTLRKYGLMLVPSPDETRGMTWRVHNLKTLQEL